MLTLSSGYTLGLGPGTDKLVTDVKGWDSGAPMRRDKTERKGGHGSFAEPGKRDERVVSVSGQHQAASRSAAALFVDELNAYLGDGELGLLMVDDVDLGPRRTAVQLLSPDVAWDKGRNVSFTLDMTAPDPRKYGDPVPVTTGPPVAGGGLSHPLFGSETPGVLDFGEPGSDGIATVTNSGTAETFATFTVQGPVPSTGFTIKETSTGRRLVYSAAIPSGSQVALDSADGSVWLDEVADRSVYLTVREWVRIPPRTTMGFLFTCLDPGALLTVEVSPAWW